MRAPASLFAVLSLGACTSTSELANEPVDRCGTTDCFNQLQVRDYEVVDNTTLVVYVGTQSCPFRVEFTGGFCDLTFLPGGDLVFRPDYLRAQREPNNLLTRVCARDSNIGIDEGPFTTAPGGEDIDPRIPCRIRDIVSLTDDELIELYVEKRITAPPPPFGTGEIEAPDAPADTEEGGPGARERAGAAEGRSEPAEATATATATGAPAPRATP